MTKDTAHEAFRRALEEAIRFYPGINVYQSAGILKWADQIEKERKHG